jgi:hypothetical protein
MQAEEILAQVKAGDRKSEWVVFPLLRGKLMWAIAGWALGILMGVLLLAMIAPIVIPYNYERGVLPIIFTTILLAVLVALVVGSLMLLIVDIRRLLNINDHIIVITYEDFVKQEGKKVIWVPLTHVRHVTPRGRLPKEQDVATAEDERVPRASGSVVSSLLGRAPSASSSRRKRMRTPTSLAFLDTRDNTEVVVVSDDSFGDPFAIAAILKNYVASVEIVRRSEK